MSNNCRVCGNGDSQLFWERVWGAPEQKVYRCNSCESFFLLPPRSPGTQKGFDQGYDRYIGDRAAFVAQYVDVQFDELVDQSIEERWRDVKSLFPVSGDLLEVGAEKGAFLSLIRDQYRSVVGVDACPEYVELLGRLGFKAFPYIENMEPSLTFDVICFFSLLEHITEPVAFLKQVRSRLRPGGRVVVEVPSANEPLVSLYSCGAFKDFYFQTMHPVVFSPKSLPTLFSRAGFQIVKNQPKQRYGLDNHLNWLTRATPGGSPRIHKIFHEIDALYRQKLEAAGMTDTQYIVAVPQPA